MKKIKINGKTITIKPIEFTGKKDFIYYEKKIYRAFKKIGLDKEFISINKNGNSIILEWIINGEKFYFKSDSQVSVEKNIGAVAQAIIEDIRQITRGIKEISNTMRQYEIKPERKINSFEKYQKNNNNNLESENSKEEIIILTKKDAREIINNIKRKYSSFTDLKYIPEGDKEKLRKAYLFLGIHPKF